jgi:hypothetical protein
MAKKPTKEISSAAPPETTALYEVSCHSIEIGQLICYRTHRVKLTREQADLINDNQPDSLKFIGI